MAEEEVKKESAPTSITVALRKPIMANGDEITSIVFREPTAGDIERVGNPVLIDMISSEVPKLTFDSKAMTQMMSVLAAVPPSSIRLMHPKDWNTAAWMLANFFTPDM